MDNCSCNCEKNGLSLPDVEITLYPGNIVVLNRFSTIKWKVCFGWFSYEGNRKICGWYFVRLDNNYIKPIQEIDLYDIYVVQNS